MIHRILLLLRIEFAVVYAYAGIAKINEDWLRGEPLRLWLGRRHRYSSCLSACFSQDQLLDLVRNERRELVPSYGRANSFVRACAFVAPYEYSYQLQLNNRL